MTNKTQDKFIGRILGERYELVSRLGEGGMGLVYRARQLSMDREVAVKLLHPGLVSDETTSKRFEVEMRAMARMEHPNAVQVFDYGRTDEGEAYLVMELLKGMTLEKLMTQGPVTLDRIISITHQVALALEAAHRKGMVHRDIKPANIMIVDAYGRSDWVKVLDFGLARLGSDTSQLTLEGAVLGTPQFMSPEQATEGKADARSDLYALGCVMFAMATGEGPFPGDELMAILYQHVNDPRPLISERSSTVYPAWLEQLILRLMAKSPEDRPQSCHEVTEILESIQEGTVPEAISQPIPILAPSPKQSKGRRMLMALILGLAILGGVLGYNASISDVKLPDYPEIREMGYEALPDYAITTKTNPITKDKVQLGRLLFFDPRLSKDDSISCSSCHDLQHFGVDNKRFSRGVGDQSSDRNSPTVFNTAGQFAQGWDGAFKSVEAQAIHPITHAKEMDSSEVEVVAKLSAIPEYQRLFRKTFGKAEPLISLKHIGIALGAFERKLLTPAPWDRFLKGDRDAINSDAKAGFVVFNQHCVNCHDGTYLGGQKFRKVGIKKKWFNTKDKGRFELTGKKRDMLKFKVPGLRNVAKTAPYFHDGSVASLTEAVRIMGEYQATPLSDEEISKIVAWLETLTGEPPAALISKPTLPGKKPSNP